MDLHDTATGIGGGLIGVVVAWLLGRTDTAKERRRKEVSEIALAAVEDSEKYVLAGEQRLTNERLASEVREVRRTVEGIDSKLDTLMLGGRIHIRRDDIDS